MKRPFLMLSRGMGFSQNIPRREPLTKRPSQYIPRREPLERRLLRPPLRPERW
jgi:hypothetical protein